MVWDGPRGYDTAGVTSEVAVLGLRASDPHRSPAPSGDIAVGRGHRCWAVMQAGVAAALTLALAAGCSGAAVPTFRATADSVPAATRRPAPSTSRATPVQATTPRPTWEAPQAAITSAQAATKVGKVAIVCGVVASGTYARSTKGNPTFLNLDDPYPHHRFTIVIWEEDRGRFPEPPEQAFLGRPVCIQGLVQDYKGVPQITSVGLDIMSPDEFRSWDRDSVACLRKGDRMGWNCGLLLGVEADIRDYEIQERRDAQRVLDEMQNVIWEEQAADLRWREEQERLDDMLEGYQDDRYEWVGEP